MKGTRASAIIGGAGWILIMLAGCCLNSPGRAAYIAAGILVIGMTLLIIGSRLMDRAICLDKQERARRDRLFRNWINCNINHQSPIRGEIRK